MRVVALLVFVGACGPSSKQKDDNPEPDAMRDCLQEGSHRCLGSTYQTCTGGLWVITTDCPQGCVDALGCVECTPGLPFCKDGNVWSCTDEGNAGAQIQACTGVNVCAGGSCVDACADAAASKP